jgi:phosphoesterase RecJ-like protein
LSRDDFYILTHTNPDGDTVGSAAALCAALRQIGKIAYIQPSKEITPRYMPYAQPYLADKPAALGDLSAHTMIAVDIAAENRIPQADRELAGSVLLSIDHHGTNSLYAMHNLVRSDCAATGEIVYARLEKLGATLTKEIALPLYLAISTDTGCFKYTNTTPRTHRIAAALLATGICVAELHMEMFETMSRARVKMESALMSNAEFHYGGMVAICCITNRLVDECNACEDDLENLAPLARRIAGVEIGLLLRETRDLKTKLSARTSERYEADEICRIAGGGGGHKCAAGASLDCGVSEARTRTLLALEEYFRKRESERDT